MGGDGAPGPQRHVVIAKFRNAFSSPSWGIILQDKPFLKCDDVRVRRMSLWVGRIRSRPAVQQICEVPLLAMPQCHRECLRGKRIRLAACVPLVVGRGQCGSFRSFDCPQLLTSFCRNCGSPLPHATRSGREIIMPAGSLRDDPGVSPTIDMGWQSRAQWLSDAINLPKAN